MAGLPVDGISSTQIDSTNFSGISVQATSGTFSSLAGTFANNAVSGPQVSLEFPVAYTGSPNIGNLSFQVGTSIPSGANVATPVIFAKPFAAAPIVLLTEAGLIGSVASAPYVSGTVSTGSFMVVGGSNVTINYLAIGSGRI